MGRLSREKGLFTLLRAWEGITGFTLRIMGDGVIAMPGVSREVGFN